MVVHYLRNSGRSVRNVYNAHCRRSFSSSASTKKVRWGRVLVSGSVTVAGVVLGGSAVARYDPKYRASIEGAVPGSATVISFILDKYDGSSLINDLQSLLASYTLPSIPFLPKLKTLVQNGSDISIYKEGDMAPPTLLESLPQESPADVAPEVAEVIPDSVPKDISPATVIELTAESEVPGPKKKNNRKKNKVVEESKVEEPAADEIVPATISLIDNLQDHVRVEIADEPPIEDFVVIEAPVEVNPEKLIPAVLTVAVDEIILEPVVVEDETEAILEALGSLDYEPVLSDTVLDLLVGKAATREKAIIATISRLENAMASVVVEVKKGLEQHNKISMLVSAAKVKADSVSKATDKKVARADLVDLIDSSAAVSAAFEEGEVVDAAVKASFEKLADVIKRAEKFGLKAPIGAAHALLGKSKNDFYQSCQTAQESQVDHALLAHYQKSVTNRKKVLEHELAILHEHFPHHAASLNRMFDGANAHHAQLEELNTLITYLSNKMNRLEREIEDQQAAEYDKLKLAAEAQRVQDEKLLEERLKSQREQLKYEHEIARHAEITQAISDTRDDCHKQAERQAELHREELTVKVDRQIQDLSSFWSDEASLREAAVEAEYQCKLEAVNSTLSGINNTLEKQNELYNSSQKNKRMFCLASSLYNSVVEGEKIDIESVTSLSKQLHFEYHDDALVSVVTASLPSTPLLSLKQLRDKFVQLKTSCKRSTLMLDEECGVGSKILSYLISLLTFDGVYNKAPADGGSPTLYYLYRAEHELNEGNLDLATRYLNQLTGHPRELIKDWLVDARKLLELRQSTKVLLNYAETKNFVKY